MPQKSIKNSFNAGELSQQVDGRQDLQKYYNGCSILVNNTVLPYGGVVKRSGTEFIGQAKTKCKLFEFEFSADDNMIIEMGNLYARFYQDGARIYEDTVDILSSTEDNPVEITTDGNHGYSTGDWVLIAGVGTATSLNDKHYQVTVIDADEFSLQDVNGNNIDGTGIGVGSGGTVKRVYEIETVYDSDEVFELHFTQSADVIYMAHTNHPPQKLSRLAVNNWAIADVDFIGGPFLVENVDSADTLQFTRTGGSAASGGYFPGGSSPSTGTLTAVGHAPFQGTSLDIGTKWLLKTTRTDNVSETPVNSTNTAPSSLTNAVLTDGDFTFVISKFATDEIVKLWRKEGNGEWQEFRSFTASTSFSATELFKDVYYAWTRGEAGTPTAEGVFTAKNQTNFGIVEVTSASSTTVANVTVIDKVQQDGATANSPDTAMWAEGAWGEFRGYPVSVTFFEDRLWWAGTTNNPQTLWGSKSGDYENQTTGLLADDAVIATIQDNNMSAIQWIAARRSLICGTSNKEYAIRANNVDDPIKPDDVKASPQSTHGSNNLQPVTLNDGLFYVQRSGRKLWIMRFSFADEKFDSTDATLLANHLLELAPVDMTTQGVPDSIVWVVRSDGTLLSFSYEPTEEVAAWARHVTGSTLLSPIGLFESVASIGGSIEDEVWVSVQRTFEGLFDDPDDITPVRYIERFSTRYIDQIDEAVMLDSAVTQATGTVSGQLILASDTIRYDSGEYGSSLYGGTI